MPKQTDIAIVDDLVRHFNDDKQQRLVKTVHNQILGAITEHKELMSHVHSIKDRIKNPEHLRGKLLRIIKKTRKEKNKFDINKDNLLEKINDLSGIRIIHLHTSQFKEIDRCLNHLLEDFFFRLLEGPTAKTWDIEYKEIFKSMGVEVEDNPRMYTSVHYVFVTDSKQPVTCEIQVRTLMEEVWGEVDHTINYPEPTQSLACREQILVLARVTSSATRLVDAIFTTQKDFEENK